MAYCLVKLPNGQWAMEENGDFLLQDPESKETVTVPQNEISFDKQNYPILKDTDIRLKFISAVMENKENLDNNNNRKEPNNEQDNKSASTSAAWTYSETLNLISAVEARYEDMFHPTKKKYFWGVVAEELQSHSIVCDSLRCKKKWENLLRTYKSTKDKKRKTGRGPTRFLFFDRLDQLLGDKPNNSSPHTIDLGRSDLHEVLTNEPGRSSEVESETNPNTETTNENHNIVLGNEKSIPAKEKIKRKRRTAAEEYVSIQRNEIANKAKYRETCIQIKNRRNDLLEKQILLEERKVIALEELVKCQNNTNED